MMYLSPDYEIRSEIFHFASPDEVRRALQDKENTVVLDVRTPGEIGQSGQIEHPNWKSTRCSPMECFALSANPTQFVRNKEDTVVLYCASGRRASKAKEILVSQGYQRVLNAGGYEDIAIIQKL